MKTTLAELKSKHAKEIERLEAEQSISELLPIEPKMICIHADHASIHYGKDYPSRHTFAEAVKIYRQFSPVESEHWKDGTIECRPAEINKSASRERATMDGASIAEIKLSAGKGYVSHELTFWARVAERLVCVHVEINPPHQWLPETHFRYDQYGNCTSSRVTPKCIGEDSRRKWWTPEGSYQISYYFADAPNFESFASQVK